MKIARCLGLLALGCAAPAFAGINSWTLVGPEGASTTAVAIHPTQSDTMLAQPLTRFVRSTNAGVTWVPYSAGQGFFSNTRIAFDPSDTNRVYVGGINVYRSDDGGQTFAVTTTLVGSNGLREIAVAQDGTVYAIDGSGHAWRSQNQGSTWAELTGPWAPNGFLATIEADPNDAAVVYMAVGGAGLYRSVNRGDTWTAMPQSVGLDNVYSLAVKPGDSQRLLAGTSFGLASSADQGATWFFHGSFRPVPIVAFDPMTPANAIAIDSDGTIRRSTDSGATWPAMLNGVYLDVGGVSRVSYSRTRPGRLLLATTDGPMLSDDGGLTFAPRFAGLHGAYPANFAAADDGALYAAFSYGPAGIFRRNGNAWSDVGNAALRAAIPEQTRIDEIAVSRSDSNFIYALNGSNSLVRSADGGVSWSAPAPEFSSGTNRFPQHLAADPRTPDIAWMATYRDGLWKTVNRGVSWSKQSAGLADRIDAIGIDPANPDTLYVASNDNSNSTIYKTTNAGVTWTATGLSRFGDFHGFAFDPEDSDTVYAFGGNVLRTTNGGASWTPIDFGGFAGENQRALAMMVDPVYPSTLWVVGAQGSGSVLRSVDRGQNWDRLLVQFPGQPEVLFLDEGVLDPRSPNHVYVGITLAGIVDYEVQPDLSIELSGLTSPVSADATTGATVTIRNLGPDAASPSELRITLPSWLQATGPANCTLAGQVLSCPVSALLLGASTSIPLSFTAAQTPANGSLTLALTTHEPDPVPANNTISRPLESTTRADLAVEFVDAPTTAARGDTASIAVRVRNPGPSRARDVRLEVQADTFTILDHIALPNACTRTATTVSCQFGTLEAQSSVTLTLSAVLNSMGANLVRATGTRTGADAGASETTTHSIEGRPLADFSIEVADSPDPATPGALINYTIVVRNAGPDAARVGVTLGFTGATAGNANVTGGVCGAPGATMICDFNTIAAGASTTITLAATAASVGTASVTGAVNAEGVDRGGGNNLSTATTTVVAAAGAANPAGGKKGGGGRIDGLGLLLLCAYAAARGVRTRSIA